MKKSIARLVAAAIVASCTSPAALTAERPLTLKSGEQACFERTYTDTHLKLHPKQKVRWIRIEHPVSNEESIYADVKARFVGDRRDYSDGGVCSYEVTGVLVCGIDCDGGLYSLSERDDGKIVLKPLDSIRVTACGGEEDNRPRREIRVTDDQKSFVLDRVPASKCELEPRR